MKTATISIVLIITGAIIMLVGAVRQSKTMPVSRPVAVAIGLIILIAGIIWYILG
jgi:hypothetical protein